MLKMKKYALSFLTLTMALSSGAAFAGYVVGTAEQKTVDIPFSSPSGLTHDIFVENGLLAGPIAENAQLAKGTVTLSQNETGQYMHVKFVNGEAVQGLVNVRTLSGTNDGQNKLKVVTYAGEGFYTVSEGLNWVIKSDTPVNAFTYNIKAYLGQTVVADTYSLTMSAQRWAP
jgi:hypothetical protein